MSAYKKLQTRFRRAAVINNALGILDWDQATLMPNGSAESRSDQTAELRLMRHELIAAPSVPDDIAAAADELATQDGAPGGWHQANIRLMTRAHVHAAAVPADLVAAESRAAAACEIKWRTARAEKNFAMLADDLSALLALVREVAAAKADALGLDPYDALLDQFEPGARMAQIGPLFATLEEVLPGLIDDVIEHQSSRPAPLPLSGPFPEDLQRRLLTQIMTSIGFDFDRGRLDTSHHPFCGGALDDVRVTTRYDTDDFLSALMGAIHETGHALYEFGLPDQFAYQPVGSSGGMALHESQSLTMEMQACRSQAFYRFLAPLAREVFDADGSEWAPENLFGLSTRVARSYIRVDADEVTYPAHILLRTRLERAMIAGDLAMADLPGAWNEGMQSMLGITPTDDALGCLQDIHWPSGAFGYFPTYTMGAIAAAQLFSAVKDSTPNIDEDLARGDFTALVKWLRTKVHTHGSVTDTDGILQLATGRPLDVDAFFGHIKDRYLH